MSVSLVKPVSLVKRPRSGDNYFVGADLGFATAVVPIERCVDCNKRITVGFVAHYSRHGAVCAECWF